jgi:hypothetical protein
MSWYLKIGNAAPQLFSTYGLNRLKCRIGSQRAGSFSFTADGANADSDPLAVEGTLCTVLWNATPFFQGRLHQIPRKGSGSAESVDYELRDAWHDFERNVYQQQWNIIIGTDEEGHPTTAAQYRSECILGMDLAGNALDSGQVIADVVAWAIGVGAYCQIGNIGVAAPVPFDEVADLPCSECIKKMLRWTPDAVAWLDYSTTPPTFNVTRRPNCTAVTIPFGGNVEEVNIKALPELVVPSVVIRYLQENQTDGIPAINVIVDSFPSGSTGTEYGSLVQSTRLAGTQSTYQKVPIQTGVILAIPEGDGDDTANCDWWRNHIGWLHPFSASRLNLDDDSTSGWVIGADSTTTQNNDSGTPVDYDIDDYPNELLRGALADWMNVIHAKCTFTTSFTYNYPDTADDESLAAVGIFGGSTDGTNGTDDGTQQGIQVTVTVIGTDAVTQTYAQLSSYTQAEPVPTGLAAQLYASLSTLPFEGSYDMVSCEVGTWTLGTVLNLAGGRPEWETMNALLQEIEQDFDNGRTTLKFGAAGHLTLRDLMEQLRANRTRVVSSHIKERQSGTPGDPTVNNTTNSPFNDASTPPGSQSIPWEGYQTAQDPGDGTPPDPSATYEVVIGYGSSSIVDTLPNPSPVEQFEISIGNDGSGWDGSDYNSDSLNNVFSLISGDATYTNDRLWIGAMDNSGDGGSVLINPSDPSIYLSPNLNPADDTSTDQYIHISVPDGFIEISGGLQDGATSPNTITIRPYEIDMEFSTGGSFVMNASEPIMDISDGRSNSFLLTVGTDTMLQIYGSGAEEGGSDSGYVALDHETGLYIENADGISTYGGASITITGAGGQSIDIYPGALPSGGVASFIPVPIGSDTYYILAYNAGS